MLLFRTELASKREIMRDAARQGPDGALEEDIRLLVGDGSLHFITGRVEGSDQEALFKRRQP